VRSSANPEVATVTSDAQRVSRTGDDP